MKKPGRCAAGAALALALVGCSIEPSGSEEDASSAVAAESVNNGIHLNGLHVNGLHVNGLHVNGLHVNGTKLGGLFVNGMTLKGTSFSGTLNGAPLEGVDFTGATMIAALQDGGALTLRIDAITPSSDPEILLYDVSYSKNSVSFSPLCLDINGSPARAFPLLGYWDESEGTATGGDHIDVPSGITFACEGYAIAKCAQMGYKPWRTVKECKAPGVCHQVALSHVHQACTRMMRADYCADGMHHTREGTLVDVWDNFGLEASAKPTWSFEAEWGENGALCVETTRWSKTPDDTTSSGMVKVRKYIKDHCPERWAGPNNPSCGGPASSFYTQRGYAVPLNARSLLMSRVAAPSN